MADPAALLAPFLYRAWRTPFAWGRFDCILLLADWSAAIGAEDPAAAYRGRYKTELGAARIIRRAGGLAPLIDREFVRWTRAAVARAGDVGLVEAQTPNGLSLVGGLCLGDRWAVLARSGLTVAGFRPAAVWSVACSS